MAKCNQLTPLPFKGLTHSRHNAWLLHTHQNISSLHTETSLACMRCDDFMRKGVNPLQNLRGCLFNPLATLQFNLSVSKYVTVTSKKADLEI